MASCLLAVQMWVLLSYRGQQGAAQHLPTPARTLAVTAHMLQQL